MKLCVLKNSVRKVYVKDFNHQNILKNRPAIWYDADTNKNYDVVVTHNGKTYGFDGASNKIYLDETGNYDDDIGIQTEWETGRMGRDEFLLGKGKEILNHGYMTPNSVACLDFFVDGDYKFTKKLTDAMINSAQEGTQIGAGNVGSGAIGSGGPGAAKAYPFRWPIGLNHKGEDYKIKIRIDGTKGDFVQFDGYNLRIRPLGRYPYRRS